MLNPKKEILDKIEEEKRKFENAKLLAKNRRKECNKCPGLIIHPANRFHCGYFYKCKYIKLLNLTCTLDKEERKCININKSEFKLFGITFNYIHGCHYFDIDRDKDIIELGYLY